LICNLYLVLQSVRYKFANLGDTRTCAVVLLLVTCFYKESTASTSSTTLGDICLKDSMYTNTICRKGIRERRFPTVNLESRPRNERLANRSIHAAAMIVRR